VSPRGAVPPGRPPHHATACRRDCGTYLFIAAIVPVFGDGRIPDKAGTWEAALAEAFAAAVLSRKSRPIGGLGDYSFVRGDRVLDAAGYPPEDGLFQELARVSVENVDLGEIHYESTKDTLRTHLSL